MPGYNPAVGLYVPGHYATTTIRRTNQWNWATAPNWGWYDDLPLNAPPAHTNATPAYTEINEAPVVDFDAMLRRLEELYRKNYIQPLYPEGTPIDDETGLPL